MAVKRGDTAPDFSLPTPTGELVSLTQFRGHKAVVLFFYPKDDSAVCTKQACSFRDSYDTFQQAGAEVIGVSSDSADSHRRFAFKRQLPFLLVSDPDGSVRKLYGVPKVFGVLPGRATYIIDKQGKVQSVVTAAFNADAHVREALETVVSNAGTA